MVESKVESKRESSRRDERVGASPNRLFTAQDVARFCEVDLKTIHNYVAAGKIPHHRTEGRHLRFRRNHVLRFLEAHGYPLPSELTTVRVTVHLVIPPSEIEGRVRIDDALLKKLSSRFLVRVFETAAVAIANLLDGEPDAVLFDLEDPSWAQDATIRALKADPSTSFPAFVVLDRAGAFSREEADLVLSAADLPKLPTELARLLRVDTR